MIYTIEPDIYRITVDLPENPLKSLNSYVITGGKRNLIIDTGFNRSESFSSLKRGIKELELDMDKTDIFVTHFHADHSGLVSQIMSPQTRVFMGEIDFQLLSMSLLSEKKVWNAVEQNFSREGYPLKELGYSKLYNPARNLVGALFESTTVQDGDTLPYGDGGLQCVMTPGHTPGHICLYDSKRQILFTGDHVLFDITPNINTWEHLLYHITPDITAGKNLPNSLQCYLESLQKVSSLPVKKALTAHRENTGDFQQRIKELQLHHKNRLDDVKRIIMNSPGINGYQVASQMKWSIRVKSWAEFPQTQRWFAVGEAIAHLKHLVDSGEITLTVRDGINTYTLT